MSNRKIQFTNSEGLHDLYIDDITHIDSDKGYSIVHYKGSVYRVRKSLKNIEDRFPEDFVRSHSQTLININKIVKINEDIDPIGITVEGVDYPVRASENRVSGLKIKLGIDDVKKQTSKTMRHNWLYSYLRNNKVISLDDNDVVNEFADFFDLKTTKTNYGVVGCITMSNDLSELCRGGKVRRVRKKTSFENTSKGYPPYTLTYKIADD